MRGLLQHGLREEGGEGGGRAGVGQLLQDGLLLPVHLPHGCWSVSRVVREAARHQLLQSRRRIHVGEGWALASIDLAHDDHGLTAEGIDDCGVKHLQL